MDNEVVEIEGLTEGRRVHFVLGDDSLSPGEHRPADVIKVWNKENGCSNLVVHVDGSNDYNEYLTDTGGRRQPVLARWKTSVLYSENKEPNTWHFIEAA
jgi:hypothetical protein